MKKSANMQDRNFDNIFRQQLNVTQSFEEHQNEDWDFLSDQLDEVLPQRRKRVPMIWLLTAGLLITSSVAFYTFYRLGVVDAKLNDMKSAIQKRKKVVEPPVAASKPIAENTVTLTDENRNTQVAATTATTNVAALMNNNNTTVTSTTVLKPTTGNTTNTTVNFPLNYSYTEKSKSTSTVDRKESNDTPNATTSVPTTDNNTTDRKVTNTKENKVLLKKEDKKIIKELIEEEAPIIEEEKEEKDAKPFAFLKPVQKGLNTAKQHPDRVNFINNNYKKNKHKLDIATVLDYITPEGYSAGISVGRGISPLQFENEGDDILEGTSSYGAKGEIIFSKNFRVVGKVDYLTQRLVYHGAESNNPPQLIETPSEDYFLDKTLATQNFVQGSLGIKTVINPMQDFMLYAGFAVPTQMRLRQNYRYSFQHKEEEDVIEESYVENRGGVTFNSFNFNSGIEYKLTNNVSLHLEGTYNVQIPERQGYLPDAFSLNVGVAYNWTDNI